MGGGGGWGRGNGAGGGAYARAQGRFAETRTLASRSKLGHSIVLHAEAGRLVSWTPRRPTLFATQASGLRTEAVVRLSQWPAGSQNPRAVQPTLANHRPHLLEVGSR